MKNMILINPGSGNVKEGERKQSNLNIRQLIKDLSLTEKQRAKLKFKFVRVNDDGRHFYTFTYGKRTGEIDMPPVPLEDVRYISLPSQNIWNFPRLYVNGASWIWIFAIHMILTEVIGIPYEKAHAVNPKE